MYGTVRKREIAEAAYFQKESTCIYNWYVLFCCFCASVKIIHKKRVGKFPPEGVRTLTSSRGNSFCIRRSTVSYALGEWIAKRDDEF